MGKTALNTQVHDVPLATVFLMSYNLGLLAAEREEKAREQQIVLMSD